MRKIVNEDAVFYKNLSAEQGARIFFQAFEGSDFLEKVQSQLEADFIDKLVQMAAADILYKNIAEPHRFLQCLAEQSSQERDGRSSMRRRGFLADKLLSSASGREYPVEEAEEEPSSQDGLSLVMGAGAECDAFDTRTSLDRL